MLTRTDALNVSDKKDNLLKSPRRKVLQQKQISDLLDLDTDEQQVFQIVLTGLASFQTLIGKDYRL